MTVPARTHRLAGQGVTVPARSHHLAGKDRVLAARYLAELPTSSWRSRP